MNSSGSYTQTLPQELKGNPAWTRAIGSQQWCIHHVKVFQDGPDHRDQDITAGRVAAELSGQLLRRAITADGKNRLEGLCKLFVYQWPMKQISEPAARPCKAIFILLSPMLIFVSEGSLSLRSTTHIFDIWDAVYNCLPAVSFPVARTQCKTWKLFRSKPGAVTEGVCFAIEEDI